MDSLRKTLSQRLPGYPPYPIPLSRDEEIRAGLLGLRDAGTPELDEFAKALDDGQRDVLNSFAERMASLAVRTRRLDLVHAGLDAIDLAYRGNDWIEEYATPLLFRACALIGADPEREFEAASQRMTGRAKEMAQQYARGDYTTVRDAGYSEGNDGDGFRFMPRE